MIARVLSFKKIGSIKNPLWHIGTQPEISDKVQTDHQFNELTLIPYETISEIDIINLSKLDLVSKSHILIQCHLDQIKDLEKIKDTGLKAQVWVDQTLSQEMTDQLQLYKNKIEIVIAPVGLFDWKNQTQAIIKSREFNYRLVLVPKKSIHDPFPTVDEYYYFIDELKKVNIHVPTIITKDQFYSLANYHQNVFANLSAENTLNYAKSQNLSYRFILTLVEILNLVTFNYFSNLIMSLIKPNQPIIFRKMKDDFEQIYKCKIRHIFKFSMAVIYYQVFFKIYHFFVLYLYRVFSWPFKKIYWTIKYQIDKRIMNRRKNEV